MTFDESVHARLANINRLIAMIASLDRKFFSNHSDGACKDEPEFCASFIIEEKQLYFIDRYTRQKIRVSRKHRDHAGFSQGGTMWGLMCDFADFILTGNYTNHKHGYGGLYCPHWGYSEESMEKIKAFARTIGYLAPTSVLDAELSRKVANGEVVSLNQAQTEASR